MRAREIMPKQVHISAFDSLATNHRTTTGSIHEALYCRCCILNGRKRVAWRKVRKRVATIWMDFCMGCRDDWASSCDVAWQERDTRGRGIAEHLAECYWKRPLTK